MHSKEGKSLLPCWTPHPCRGVLSLKETLPNMSVHRGKPSGEVVTAESALLCVSSIICTMSSWVFSRQARILQEKFWRGPHFHGIWIQINSQQPKLFQNGIGTFLVIGANRLRRLCCRLYCEGGHLLAAERSSKPPRTHSVPRFPEWVSELCSPCTPGLRFSNWHIT